MRTEKGAILRWVALTKLDQVRAIMPAEGTDLTDVFGANAPQIDTGGLVRDDATVNMVARNAERAAEGPEGFREIWADWLEPWESYRIYYDDVIERGDKVIMLVRLRGVTKHDGVEMEHEAASVFRFDGDQVVEMEFNLDREDALSE
jgi:ketosteroid isomerase-like protein